MANEGSINQVTAAPSLLALLVTGISTILASLPAGQAEQLAALAGTFIGNVGKPIVQQEIYDAFEAMFGGTTAEDGRAGADFDGEFDELRKQPRGIRAAGDGREIDEAGEG